MTLHYSLKFVVQKCMDLMQKVHNQNIEIMKTFLTSIEEQPNSLLKETEENQITEEYDEDFCEEKIPDRELMAISIRGHERIILDYLKTQISSFPLSSDKKSYLFSFSSGELQEALSLTTRQISRALYELSKKNILTRYGEYSPCHSHYRYTIKVPIEVL